MKLYLPIHWKLFISVEMDYYNVTELRRLCGLHKIVINNLICIRTNAEARVLQMRHLFAIS